MQAKVSIDHEAAVKAVADSEKSLSRVELAKAAALRAEARGAELIAEAEDKARQAFLDGAEPGRDLLQETVEAREQVVLYRRVVAALRVDEAAAKFDLFVKRMEEAESREVMFGELLQEHIDAQAEVARGLAAIEGGDVAVGIEGPRSTYLKEAVKAAGAEASSMRSRLSQEEFAVQVARQQVPR
ncbi:hypothetical protein [uncultured Paludibaculum sp.]|uniref:hypothetical protein n=1 Tax=uncultured Paludibaculum sp. TaxID=1765020 RepID=UPI002AAB85AB|nr:hypothetical protein [uncultured Paludibaculum sp.]